MPTGSLHNGVEMWCWDGDQRGRLMHASVRSTCLRAFLVVALAVFAVAEAGYFVRYSYFNIQRLPVVESRPDSLTAGVECYLSDAEVHVGVEQSIVGELSTLAHSIYDTGSLLWSIIWW